MKLQVIDGEIVLADVFNGIGIQTDMGIFAIAQRDDGVEVMLNGKSVWASSDSPAQPIPSFHDAASTALYQARNALTGHIQRLHATRGGHARASVIKAQRALARIDAARSLLDQVYFADCTTDELQTPSPYYAR